jgi:hypothetical protein
MDANSYYLNEYMNAHDAWAEWQSECEELAQAEVEDTKSEYYPWTPKNVWEALSELPNEMYERIVEAREDDKALAMVVREAVAGYWYQLALNKIEWERK